MPFWKGKHKRSKGEPTPPPPEPLPWEAFLPAPFEERDPGHFYGPDPDSPEGVASARILNKRRLGGDTSPEPYVPSPPFRQLGPLEIEQVERLHRDAADEPPRMYVVRRRVSGLVELLGYDGKWTQHFDQAEYFSARQAQRKVPQPEDSDPVSFEYDIVPADQILWEIQRGRENVETEGLFVRPTSNSK